MPYWCTKIYSSQYVLIYYLLDVEPVFILYVSFTTPTVFLDRPFVVIFEENQTKDSEQ